ncbi:MAG: GYF domain-containing protein [Candidatus Eisenbacteria bacterium]
MTQPIEWWYAEGNEQKGPVNLEEIKELAATGVVGADTLVWHSGMAGWTPAGRVAELGLRPTPPSAGLGADDSLDIGGSSDPSPLGSSSGVGGGMDEPARPAPPRSSSGAGSYSGSSSGTGDLGGFPTGGGYGHTAMPMRNVPNNMVLAILSTVLCCLPLGIASIVKASQVKAIAESGDIERAEKVAAEAKKWALWAIGLGLLAQILYFLLVGSSAFLGMMDAGKDF